MQRARTEREWRCQLTHRCRKWGRLVSIYGKRAKVADLGPIPLPPVSMVEYYTPVKNEQK